MKTSYNCIRCNKLIKKIIGSPDDSLENCMWADGIVDKISAGFGSSLDGDIYILGVCDDCLKILHDMKKITFYKNYISSNIKK